MTWTIGPKKVIEAVTSAGSFLDGGGSRPLQRAAIDLLSPEATLAETAAIQAEFGKKRAKMLNGLRDCGFTVDLPPEGTFYVWASAQHSRCRPARAAEFSLTPPSPPRRTDSRHRPRSR